MKKWVRLLPEDGRESSKQTQGAIRSKASEDRRRRGTPRTSYKFVKNGKLYTIANLECVSHHLRASQELVQVDAVFVVVLEIYFVECQLEEFRLKDDEGRNVE